MGNRLRRWLRGDRAKSGEQAEPQSDWRLQGFGDSLNSLVEKCPESLSNVNFSESVLIDVIADSGACATAMPKHTCGNIRLGKSAGSKSGDEYEVASGKAVPILGERHCEIFCEGAASSMMMHFQVAVLHRLLLLLSKAADR